MKRIILCACNLNVIWYYEKICRNYKRVFHCERSGKRGKRLLRCVYEFHVAIQQ